MVFINKHEILVSSRDKGAVVLDLLDLATGQLRPYSRIEAIESTGMSEPFSVMVAKDLGTFVCSRQQSLTDLFVMSGWS